MDNKTRLRKIIAKAIDNNWNFIIFMDNHFAGYGIDRIHDTWFEFVFCNEMVLQAMLLNPDFLKAYFGEGCIHHAYNILDLILEGKDPLEYFDRFEEE